MARTVAGPIRARRIGMHELPEGDDARHDLERRLQRAAARWGVALEPGRSHSPRGCVALGRRADGAPVAIKIVATLDERPAAAALAHWAGQGSVLLLAHADDALLLERASPGTDLAGLTLAGRDDEATAILCDVAARLHEAPPPRADAGFPTVEEWARAFARWRAAGALALPAALVDRAAGIHRELAASQRHTRLLHGDLQHFNVLRDTRRGWLAIDPKGVIGEPAWEMGAAFRNPCGVGFEPASSALVDRRAGIMSERLSLDRDRVLGWAFAQAVLSAVWSVEDGESPDQTLAVALAVRGVR